jgi:hypothetical protein
MTSTVAVWPGLAGPVGQLLTLNSLDEPEVPGHAPIAQFLTESGADPVLVIVTERVFGVFRFTLPNMTLDGNDAAACGNGVSAESAISSEVFDDLSFSLLKAR